jgi:DNA invertase Pin-like site-specific DNA recombinase
MGKTQKKITAFAYLRTSSAANVGDDKDSEQRQRTSIEAYAKRAGIDLIGAYYDAAVKGSDPVETRPGFAALLEAIEANGTRTIIVETANRFARAESEAKRPPIPTEGGHRFRSKAATQSERRRPPC